MSASTRSVSRFPVVAIALVLVSTMTYFVFVPKPQVTLSAGTSVTDDGIDWEGVIALETRHTNDSHKIVNNPVAQARVATTMDAWRVAPPQFDPKNDSVLCKAVRFARGVYHAIWMAEPGTPDIGTVSVYHDGGWLTSYTGNPRGAFTEGTPKGSLESGLVPCNTLMPPPLPG